MRVAVLTVEAPNQAALCQKLARVCEVVGIVFSRNRPSRPPSQRLRRLLNRIAGRVVGLPFVRAWHQMQRRFATRYPSFPDVSRIGVRNVNDEATVRFLERVAADLVLVSGTNLVGRRLIEWAGTRQGILNLHTGLSPYVKGGPDCTNWCLAERALHLIGSTVMRLDAWIDSGPILATEQTPLDGSETLEALHWKVMNHAHDLCVRTVNALSEGHRVPCVPQSSVAEGRTFSTVNWNARAMWKALSHFRRDYTPAFFRSPEYQRLSASLRLFPLKVEEPAALEAG